MAINTAASPIKLVDTGRYTFYGYDVPKNVYTIRMMRQVETDSDVVDWICRNGSVHSMTIHQPVDTDQIIAVLAAMRMSC